MDFIKQKGGCVAVEIELLTHKTIYPEFFFFVKENCQRLMLVLTSLESQSTPLACLVYNLLEDLRSYPKAGISKTSFGEETNRLLEFFSADEKKKHIKFFHTVFHLSLQKLRPLG